MKRIDNINLNNKKVIIRVDYNVPLDDNLNIIDDNRIKESLETINYCLERNCKIILLSHLGRIKTEEDKVKNSLKPISIRLSQLLNKNVLFIPYTKGKIVEKSINNMKEKDIILLENTRFEDLNNKAESKNNQELASYWASLGDVFINDAFATCHRENASNVGIRNYIKESCLGFLVLKELDNLKKITDNKEKPFIVILGGAKISTKIKTIENLVNKADYILIGGGMAYTFLKAKGIETGNSIIDTDSLDFCKNILNKTNKIILPIDHVVSSNKDNNNYEIKTNLNKLDIGLDIGPETIKLFSEYINNSKVLFWNGPMGYYENETYQEGTKKLCEIISKSNTTSIVGGGDTASCIINMGYKDKFSYISTGGGATLYLLEGNKLPGIDYEN